MDNPADTPDQTDEDILTHTASDEAVEAAAGIEGGCVTWPSPLSPGAPRRSRCHPGANALGRMEAHSGRSDPTGDSVEALTWTTRLTPSTRLTKIS